jgi:hypothetical protein
MEGNTKAIVHYRAVSDAHSRWCSWARRRRWCVYLLAVWEVVCVGALAVLGQIAGRAFTEREVLWSFAPTLVLTFWFFLTEFMLIGQQDTIDDYRDRYKDV